MTAWPTRARARCACRLSRIRPAASTPATPAIAAKQVRGTAADDAGVADEATGCASGEEHVARRARTVTRFRAPQAFDDGAGVTARAPRAAARVGRFGARVLTAWVANGRPHRRDRKGVPGQRAIARARGCIAEAAGITPRDDRSRTRAATQRPVPAVGAVRWRKPEGRPGRKPRGAKDERP